MPTPFQVFVENLAATRATAQALAAHFALSRSQIAEQISTSHEIISQSRELLARADAAMMRSKH